MTLDDYFNARMITTPFGMLDCDVPCDGSVAFVVSHVDTADDGPHPAIGIESIGWAMRHRPLWDQWADMTEMAAWDAAAHLWERSDLRPADVDQVQLYDGFSFLPLVWLEALRFCGKGESGPFLESGKRIALDGPLPLNTGGGQLSAGRLHGCGLLYEACVQLARPGWRPSGGPARHRGGRRRRGTHGRRGALGAPMSAVVEVALIRHGLPNRIEGVVKPDPGLTESGFEQARAVADAMVLLPVRSDRQQRTATGPADRRAYRREARAGRRRPRGPGRIRQRRRFLHSDRGHDRRGDPRLDRWRELMAATRHGRCRWPSFGAARHARSVGWPPQAPRVSRRSSVTAE